MERVEQRPIDQIKPESNLVIRSANRVYDDVYGGISQFAITVITVLWCETGERALGLIESIRESLPDRELNSLNQGSERSRFRRMVSLMTRY